MANYTKFVFTVPKSEEDKFKTHILKKIYNVENQYRVLEENETSIKIETHLMKELLPLYNIIPKANIIDPSTVWYSNESVLTFVKDTVNSIVEAEKAFLTNYAKIDKCNCCGVPTSTGTGEGESSEIILDARTPEYSVDVTMTDEDLENFLKQLCTSNIIQGYVKFHDYEHLVTIPEIMVVILLKFHENKITLQNFESYEGFFDVDDGFVECGSEILDKVYQEWKEIGDITKPVFPELIV